MLVSVRELKTHLSKYLSLVQAGESVIVTSHSNPVVKLVALDTLQSEASELDQLVGGAAQWNGKKPMGAEQKPLIGKRKASDVVLEDRG